MENIVNKILSLDFDSVSYLQRLKLCKEVLRKCESEIPNKTEYAQPKLHLIMNEFDANVNSRSINEKIYLDRNAFSKNGGFYLAETLWDIAHECCHGAQQNDVSFNEKQRDISNLLILDPEHYYHVYRNYEVKCDKELIKKSSDLQESLEIESRLNNVENFLKGFYWLHPVEREADNFAKSFIEDFISSAQNMDLNTLQRNRLKALKKGFVEKKAKNQQQVDKVIEQKNNNEIKSEIISSIREMRGTFFDDETFKNISKIDFSDNFMLVMMTFIRGLELDYDDKLAHNLFKAFYNSDNIAEWRKVLLHNLVGFTNIQLTKEEDVKFRKMLASFGAVSVDYDSFMKQKAVMNSFITDYMKPSASPILSQNPKLKNKQSPITFFTFNNDDNFFLK